MDKREKSVYKNKLVTGGSAECTRALSRFIRECDNKKAFDLLTIIEDYNLQSCKILLEHRENDDETILHTAAKYHEDDIMVNRLVKLCPQLLTQSRENSDDYRGQTALHIAITKGNNNAVRAMLSEAKESKTSDVLARMMYTEAMGARFVNTVMLGGVPLSVAALTFYTPIVQTLIEYGAEIEFTNNDGDTVFHSLIKYAAIYPEKVPFVVDMLKDLHEVIQDNGMTDRVQNDDGTTLQYKDQYAYVWLIRNNEHLTPLQLAAKHGVVDVFHCIMNLEDVYCFFNTHDGLFDIKMYDVTEVDSLANVRAATAKKGYQKRAHSRGSVIPKREGIANKSLNNSQNVCVPCYAEYPETESILEMMFKYSYQSKDAFRLIEMAPVKNLVRAKWTFYRWIYYPWAAFHMLFMVALTAYAVFRPYIFYNTAGTSRLMRENDNPEVNSFISVFKWFALVCGLLYCMVSVLLFVPKFRRPNVSEYLSHNLEYTLLLSVCSSCIVIDTFMTMSDDSHNSIPLIIALVTGWWFNVFFLRALRVFSFFTELIKRVIIGDLFRFGIVMLFEMISFTAAMHILFQMDVPDTSGGTSNASTTVGSVTVEQSEYSTYWKTMLAMFKLMLGLGDLETLTDSRVPWLSVTLFVIFVIITYILLLNALIAMMSQTCALVLEDRYPQWRIQQLSVILFLEDILCLCCLNRLLPCHSEERMIRGFDAASKQYKSDKRFLLEIHSLQMQYATEEDKSGVRKTMMQDGYNHNGSYADNTMGYAGMAGYDMNRSTTFAGGSSEDFSFSPRRRNTPSMRMSMRRKRPESSIRADARSRPVTSTRRQLSVLEEESDIDSLPQPTSRLEPPKTKVPAIITSDDSPVLTRKHHSSKRKRHKSENLHEKNPPSPKLVHSGDSPADLYASAPANLPSVGNGHEVDIQTVHHSHA